MARFLASILVLTSFAAHARDLDKQYEKAKFKLGKTVLQAYVADTDEKRAEGLMFVEKLPKNTGMLFVFPDERPLGFWMKNTLIPLSIGYFDAKGVLKEVQEMKVASSLLAVSPPTYHSRKPGLFALEMDAGWFDKNAVKPGARLTLLSSTKSTLLKAKLKPAKKAGR